MHWEINSYHGNIKEKADAISKAKDDAAHDMLIKDSYSQIGVDGFKGCSVGCDAYAALGGEGVSGDMVMYRPHAITAAHYGIPEWIEHVRDSLFQRMPDDCAITWHFEYKEAMPVGKYNTWFDRLEAKFIIHMLNTLKASEMGGRLPGVIDSNINVYETVLKTGEYAPNTSGIPARYSTAAAAAAISYGASDMGATARYTRANTAAAANIYAGSEAKYTAWIANAVIAATADDPASETLTLSLARKLIELLEDDAA